MAIISAAAALLGAPPAPSKPLPRGNVAIAEALAATTADLNSAIDRWLAFGNPSRGRPPLDVTLLALHQQRVYRRLSRETRLARLVVRRLPLLLRAHARDTRSRLGARSRA